MSQWDTASLKATPALRGCPPPPPRLTRVGAPARLTRGCYNGWGSFLWGMCAPTTNRLFLLQAENQPGAVRVVARVGLNFGHFFPEKCEKSHLGHFSKNLEKLNPIFFGSNKMVSAPLGVRQRRQRPLAGMPTPSPCQPSSPSSPSPTQPPSQRGPCSSAPTSWSC